jgi:hypothetical protein
MRAALNQQLPGADRDYAVRLLHSVCCLAGEPEFLMHRTSGGKRSLTAAIERRDTAALFDWLVQALSYQGIADRIAYDYMQRHGQARWARIMASLARNPSCPKLGGYWRFYDCRYRKGSGTCAEPRHIAACPLRVYRALRIARRAWARRYALSRTLIEERAVAHSS